MIYREYLVMRKALAWFAGLLLAGVLIGLVTGAIKLGPDHVDYAGIATLSGWLAAVFASIFGVALGNGSREVARVLWVLPAARWKLASQVISVDLAGTTVVFAVVYAVTLFLSTLSNPYFRLEEVGRVSVIGILMSLTMAFATYGWSALAGMLGRRMPYCGLLALPALMIWMVLAQTQRLGPILRGPIVANPFAVFNAGLTLDNWERHRFVLSPVVSSLQWLGTTWATPVLVAIFAVTCGLAVLLWQRAQAISA
jgi:hypothetical protein